MLKFERNMLVTCLEYFFQVFHTIKNTTLWCVALEFGRPKSVGRLVGWLIDWLALIHYSRLGLWNILSHLVAFILLTDHDPKVNLTYAHRPQWSKGHLRPLAVALCSGLFWPFRTSRSLAVSALLQCLASNCCRAGLSSSSPADSKVNLRIFVRFSKEILQTVVEYPTFTTTKQNNQQQTNKPSNNNNKASKQPTNQSRVILLLCVGLSRQWRRGNGERLGDGWGRGRETKGVGRDGRRGWRLLSATDELNAVQVGHRVSVEKSVL